MNWFKHYVNASDDIRVFRLKDEMGYTGLGIYWTIMEMMARGGGCYARAGLMALKNRRTPKERIACVLDGFGLFHTDADGRVTAVPPAADERPTSGLTPPKTERTEAPKCSDTKEDSPASLAHTHVEEKREEKKREEAPSNSPKGGESREEASSVPSPSERDREGLIFPPLGGLRGAIIHELRTNRSWQEAVCITSGYGALLMRHFDRAVDIFLQHVKAGADEVELTDRRRAMNYFRNFTRLSHPAGRRLKEELERMDSPPQSPRRGEERCNTLLSPPLGESEGASPFEDPPGPNGERSYHGGRPLPPDAPPRPSPHAEWDEAEGKWWEGWTLPQPLHRGGE